MELNDKYLLQRIANHLMMNTSCTKDIGLYHGKMGIVIFFVHYSRYMNNDTYSDFASEILNEVYMRVNVNLPIDFENGLCGIGWGIEYLLQNDFVEGDGADILFDVDKKIMERDLKRITDLNFKTGLEGISCYIQSRILSSIRNSSILPFDSVYLSDWECCRKKNMQYLMPEVLKSIVKDSFCQGNFHETEIGLEKGHAGFALKKILW